MKTINNSKIFLIIIFLDFKIFFNYPRKVKVSNEHSLKMIGIFHRNICFDIDILKICIHIHVKTIPVIQFL